MNIGKALRIIIPFGLAYLFSLTLRSINAVFAHFLQEQLHLSASEIGITTRLFWLTFAGCQIFSGTLLDRFDPKFVVGFSFLFAALGLGIFGASSTTWGLGIGRALMGVGVMSILNGAMKSVAYWFPGDSRSLMNSVIQAMGGLGVVLGTAPVEVLTSVIGWRAVCLVLGIIILLISYLTIAIVPTEVQGADHPPLKFREAMNYRFLFSNRAYWKLMIPTAVCFGAFTALQGLWISGWLIGGLEFSSEKNAFYLLVIAIVMVIGMLSGHSLVRFAKRIHLSTTTFMNCMFAVFTATIFLAMIGSVAKNILIWIVFSFMAQACYMQYTVFARICQHKEFGRAASFGALLIFSSSFIIQFCMGLIVSIWTKDAHGFYPDIAYQTSYLVVGVLCAIAVLVGFILKGEAKHVQEQQ